MNTIKKEQQEALDKYGHFNSTHEVYAVILEEVDEFWQEVKNPTLDSNNTYPLNGLIRKRDRMINELTQIAAIAQRAIQELENNEIRWI